MIWAVAQAQAKPEVGLVMKSLANEFFKDMTEGAVRHQKKRGDFALKTSTPCGLLANMAERCRMTLRWSASTIFRSRPTHSLR